MNPCITTARVMTRDGYCLDPIALVEERHTASERQQMLAKVARIETRLELERSFKRNQRPMATRQAPDRPIEVRYQPRYQPHPLLRTEEPQDRVLEIIRNAAAAALLAGFVLIALWLGGALK